MSKQSADWAILVYISADRILTNFAIESLKQLRRSASNGIVALAQMQATGEPEAQRYVFDGTRYPNSSIENNLRVPILPAPFPGGIANPQNLTEFIKWAAQYEAKHRCLFLWGHGYELLLNDDLPNVRQGAERDRVTSNGLKESQNAAKPAVPEAKSQVGGNDLSAIGRNYLTPRSLKAALQSAKLFAGQLDIIGVDACSMCLIELASELADYGNFLIASQEDVPDASFPYEQLLLNLKDHDRDDVEGICAAIPKLYAQAYQDYVVGPETGMKEITLTSLRLRNIASITKPLTGLATALLASAADPVVRKTVLGARKASRDFALGLFVDLYDFCSQLRAKLSEGDLRNACDTVLSAVAAHGQQGFIAANKAGGSETRCHGLSIYFPYLTQAEMDQTRQSLLTSTTATEQVRLMVKGGTNIILKARSVQISQIEGDFESLVEFEKTGWNAFIKHGWSVILASEEPNELDEHYSGEQCALNLLSLWRSPEPPGQPSPSSFHMAAAKG